MGKTGFSQSRSLNGVTMFLFFACNVLIPIQITFKKRQKWNYTRSICSVKLYILFISKNRYFKISCADDAPTQKVLFLGTCPIKARQFKIVYFIVLGFFIDEFKNRHQSHQIQLGGRNSRPSITDRFDTKLDITINVQSSCLAKLIIEFTKGWTNPRNFWQSRLVPGRGIIFSI